MTTEADTTALTYRLPQQRKLVTELPGPRSKEFAARRGRAVAAARGAAINQPAHIFIQPSHVKGAVLHAHVDIVGPRAGIFQPLFIR